MATNSSGMITSTTTGGNVLRITGMASGLDVDGTVTKLMVPEQYKIDTAKSDRQILQWKQDAYKDIINDIKTMQTSFFDVGSPDTNLLSSANYSAFTVTASNTAVASATAGVTATAGTYGVEVTQLASGANFSSTLANNVTLSSKLGDIDAAYKVPTIKLSINVNGGVANASNGGSNIAVSLDNSSGNLTMSDLVNAINAKGNGTVKASYSELTKQLKLTTVATGQDQNMAFDTTGATAADSAALASLTNLFGTYNSGQNAIVKITPPGSTTAITVNNQKSNNFSIDGVAYNISSIGTSAISVAKDTSKVYDKISGFLDKYNALVDKIKTKLTEKSDKNYKPLTDTQKSSMSEDQINTWEAKAKVGVLRNDDNLQQLLTNLHQAFSTPVSGSSLAITKYGSASFGIDTSAETGTSEEIKIVDAAKLKTAIADNSDALMKIFTNVSTSKDDTTKNKENGIFTRIQGLLVDNVGYISSTLNGAILTKYANSQDAFSVYGDTGLNTLPDQLYSKDALIKQLQTSFADKQTAYYNKFAKLETAMTNLNNQQSTLTSMLSNG